jgi:ketosteroid isomerase-like protein
MPEEPTTPDLVELTRRMVEAGSRRDVDGGLAMYSRAAVWDMSAVGMGVFEGHEAIRRFFQDWAGAYETFEQELEEVRDLGNGVTFTVILQRGRPTGSSGFLEVRYAGVRTWADGLVDWYAVYTDIDEARAAAERLAQERG